MNKEREQELHKLDMEKLYEESLVTAESLKIRYFTAQHGTYYCMEDICSFLEGHDAIKHAGKEARNWLTQLSTNLSRKLRNRNDRENHLMGIDCFMMMGLYETYVHWVTVEGVLRKIVKVWSEPVKALNREIDYEEDILDREFFITNFREVAINKSGANVHQPNYKEVKELITPERAKELLKNSFPVQMRLNQKLVDGLANLMTSGSWIDTDRPITVGKLGGLDDGIHRMAALIKANKSLEFHVRYEQAGT